MLSFDLKVLPKMDTTEKNLGKENYREGEIGYSTPNRLNPVKYGYGDFYVNIQITKQRDQELRKTNRKNFNLLSAAFRALKSINTKKARTLRSKIATKLRKIYQDKTTIHPYNPTQRDRDIVEGWNNYYEFINALKVHYDKPLSFENSESPEDINTLRKQKNQFCYSYNGLSKTRMITKKDDLFKLSNMRAGWKYTVTFRCPLCGDQKNAQYKPKGPKGKKRTYKIPAHECETTTRASNYRSLITTTSLRVLRYANLFDKAANVDRNPNTYINRYGTHSGEKARLIETQSYRLGNFPTKPINNGLIEYAVTKVIRTKRLKTKQLIRRSLK